MIKLLIVDDSRVVRRTLAQFFCPEAGFEVVGEAANGLEAIERALALKPDVILMDLEMPEMDGIQATAEIMSSEAACPIVVLSSLTRDAPERAYQALAAGAVELLNKPDAKQSFAEIKDGLLRAVRTMSKARVLRRHSKGMRGHKVAEPGYRALLIGSSTGGPEILTRILSRLPAPLPVPVLIAQHVLPNYEAGLALWLTRAGHQARVAVAGERPQAGVVYLGRGDHHLTLNAQGVFEEHPKQAEEACPSADALFKSAARACAGARLISVVLTGMGRDGAEGSVALRDAGAYTLAQALETCVVPSMPAEAIKAGGIREQLSPEEIAARIVALLRLTPLTPHL